MPTTQNPLYRNEPLHSAFVPTAEQAAKLADLRTRLETTIAAQDKPWRATRARQLLSHVKQAAATRDGKLIGQFLHEWGAGIEGELRTLAGSAAQRSAAA